MRKILTIAVVASMTSLLTSCAKDYTCTCDVLGVSVSETQNMKKKDAKEWCEEADADAAVLGGSCSLD